MTSSHKAKCELAGEVLSSFGSVRFAATGWSMLPAIWPGETLVVERASAEEIGVGDIVLVECDRGLRAHRILAIRGSGETRRWITKGDALSAPDPPVKDADLLGRVAFLIRGGKCVPVPNRLGLVENLLAKIALRSIPTARALVYLNRKRQG